MNLKNDLTKTQQSLLEQINYPIENREYTQDELNQCVSIIGEHVMSKSSKNGDISNELDKFDDLVKILVKTVK